MRWKKASNKGKTKYGDLGRGQLNTIDDMIEIKGLKRRKIRKNRTIVKR